MAPKALDSVTVSGARESASTRLQLTPRETPQSVSTVTRAQIERQSLTSIDSVLRNVNGIAVSFYDTQRPLYYARGFQITDFQTDGLPSYSSSTNQEFDTALYERIDIVRGANGIQTGVGGRTGHAEGGPGHENGRQRAHGYTLRHCCPHRPAPLVLAAIGRPSLGREYTAEPRRGCDARHSRCVKCLTSVRSPSASCGTGRKSCARSCADCDAGHGMRRPGASILGSTARRRWPASSAAR